jgi:hypothetical protein
VRTRPSNPVHPVVGLGPAEQHVDALAHERPGRGVAGCRWPRGSHRVPAPGLRRDLRSRTVADVDPFRGLGMPGMPGLGDLLSLLQKQSEALAQLPNTLIDLNRTIRELTEATALARETIESAQRITERLEGLVEELQQPVRALKPGLERVGRVLDDPAVDTVPETLRRIHDDLMPLIAGLRQAQSRVGSVTGVFRRRPRSHDAPDP